MSATAPVAVSAPQRKRRNAYHHGNLRQALVDQAVKTIRADGVEALTLRDVGAHLRVSRTALYRHFADKQALLVAVATEGFRVFRKELAEAWEGAGRVGKDREQPIHGQVELLPAILQEGEKGLTLQRYKGLGEMNPEQLWETTLDPEARTLLQVKIEDLAEADDIFTKLMGDVVEPRREFIQANALSVEHLDA